MLNDLTETQVLLSNIPPKSKTKFYWTKKPTGNHYASNPANHQCWWPDTLIIAQAPAIIKVSGHQHRWLAGGCDLEIGHF